MTLNRYGIAGSSLCLIGLALAVEGRKESASSMVRETRGQTKVATLHDSEKRLGSIMVPAEETKPTIDLHNWVSDKELPIYHYDLLKARFIRPTKPVWYISGPPSSFVDSPTPRLVISGLDIFWFDEQPGNDSLPSDPRAPSLISDCLQKGHKPLECFEMVRSGFKRKMPCGQFFSSWSQHLGAPENELDDEQFAHARGISEIIRAHIENSPSSALLLSGALPKPSCPGEQVVQAGVTSDSSSPSNAEPRVDLLEPEPLDSGWQRDVTVVLRPLGYEEATQQPPPPEPMPIAPSQVQPASVAPAPVSPPVQPMPTWKTAPARKPAKAESLPLTGTHPCTLDDQNSLALPRRVQEQLGETRVRTVFVTAGPDACLWIYSPAGLEHLANQLEQKPGSKTQAQVFQRLYFAHTEPVPVDRHGWINIPEHLARFAGLGHDVVLIGVRDHFELWDAQRWQQYLEQNAPETRSNRKGRAAHAGKAELEE